MVKFSQDFRMAKIILKIIVFVFLIGLLARFVPGLVISNGLNRFQGEEREFAKLALKASRRFVGGSAEPLLVTKLKVLKVEKIPGVSDYTKICQVGDQPILANFVVEVRGYTFFGIPYTEIVIKCESSYRKYFFFRKINP